MEPNYGRIPYQGCPLCDSSESGIFFTGNCTGHPLYKPLLPAQQRWLKCEKCGHIYVEGYFTPDALAVIFSDTHPNQIPGYDIEQQRYAWSRVVDLVQQVRPQCAGRWLDVGFGNGGLLSTASEYGYDVVGLDLREESVRLMREFGFEAHARDLHDYNPDEPFDVVSMADVLEHMPFPRQALLKLHDLLKPDGLFFVSLPNADSFLWQQLTRNGANPYWGELEHYHNFGRTRLYALLEECGFRPLHYSVSFRYRACMQVIAQRVSPS